MALEIFWSQYAKLKLYEIYLYYKSEAGEKIAKKIINGIVDHTIHLDRNSEIGQVESVLEDKDREFRYLVYTNYKIVYYINRRVNRIVIANVFDTRQNPEKMKETE